MRKLFNRIFGISFFALCILVYMIILPLLVQGYDLYENAKESLDLDEMIIKIKSDENFIPIEDIPEDYINELLISEDKRFYRHFGVDLFAITRAAYNDIRLGYFAQGGSTITQQLAKNFYFSFEKTYIRKIAELFMAFDLENKFTKNEILELYINISYFGENCYGLKEASMHYFGVHPRELKEIQRAALIWTIKSPNNYNPNVYDQEKLKDTILKELNKSAKNDYIASLCLN